jgi:hypothetical protein
VYIDDNPVAALTATVGAGIGYGTGSGLEWGDKLMQTDFDYVRWTTGGAYAPSIPGSESGCELLWDGVEQNLNDDYSVDMLDLYEWVNVWLNCNDPAGCP